MGGDDRKRPAASCTRENIVPLIGYIDYMLKGATYEKVFDEDLKEDKTTAKESVEATLLNNRNKNCVSEYIIHGGLPELRKVFGRKSDILNRPVSNGKNGKNQSSNKLGVHLRGSMCTCRWTG